MKNIIKITCFILCCAVILSLFSCSSDNDPTDPAVVFTEPAVPTTEEAVPDDTFDAISTDRSFYGIKDDSADTYTCRKPLPLNEFNDARIENDKNLPSDLISHGFGVAKDEKPNLLSVNNQKFFDDGGYDAVCLDTKTEQKVLYLTFDCGYENGYTEKILDILKEKNVKAAFFCTLDQVKATPELIARMINDGHVVGNHSVTHPVFADISRSKMYDEIKGLDDYLREHFGYSSLYFRYPHGKYSESSIDLINSMGYRAVFWSLAYEDWDLDNQKGAEYARKTVVSRLHPGAVILLHAVSPDNAGALSDIIDDAREMGYEFLSLDEMKR